MSTEPTGEYDAVISSCALYHIADLDAFFASAERVLQAGGLLCFSVDPATEPFEIAQTAQGEFAHSRRYLRRVAASQGFQELDIRILEHRMYPGFYCAFRAAGDTQA